MSPPTDRELNQASFYMCFKKGCSSYHKSIQREVIKGEIEQFLLSLKPSKELFNLTLAIFKELWKYRLEFQKTHSKSLQLEINKTEKKIGQLLDRIVEAESRAVVSAYEKRIGELQLEKQIIQEKVANFGRPLKGFDETFRTAMDFLANPHELWASGRIEDRHTVMKLTFADRLAYVRGEGFRTPKTTLPFNALGNFCGVKAKWRAGEDYSGIHALTLRVRFAHANSFLTNLSNWASHPGLNTPHIKKPA